MATETSNLFCKHCGESADSHLCLAMAAAFGASVYPPPHYCPTSPTKRHDYEERKPAPASEQYRYLEPGEIIQSGDECEVSNSIHDPEKWQPAKCIGQEVPLRMPAHRIYRRRIKPAPASEPPVLVSKDRPWSDYPLGTRAHSCEGGYWTRVPAGWKLGGDTFPTPGASAVGPCIEWPAQLAPASGGKEE